MNSAAKLVLPHYSSTRASLEASPGYILAFNEYREEFLENMSQLGLDFEAYEKQDKFMFLEALNIDNEEAVTATLESLLSTIDVIGAKGWQWTP